MHVSHHTGCSPFSLVECAYDDNSLNGFCTVLIMGVLFLRTALPIPIRGRQRLVFRFVSFRLFISIPNKKHKNDIQK